MFAILVILTRRLKNRGQQNKGIMILKLGVEALATYQYSGFRKISSRPCRLFFLFMTKRMAFKCSLVLHFYAFLLDYLHLPRCGSDSKKRYRPRFVSRTDCGFDQWLGLSFTIKKLFVYLFMAKQRIHLIIQMYYKQIDFHLL